MGIDDDDGIGVRYVDTVLHNGCREQHIVVVVHESHNDLLQFLGLHLSVSYRHAAVGHVLFYHQFQLHELRYTVDDDIRLSVTAHLEVDGICHSITAEGHHLRLYRVSVGRRRAHDAHVACTHQRELQSAGNRCGTHRQRVDIHLQLAQLLLGADAELLFLVDDEQTEVMPFHSLGNQLVRPHYDVCPALLEVFQQLSGLLGGACPTQVVHLYRHSLQSVSESLVVLKSQHRGRHQHCHLLAVACRLEGCAYRHLRLSEAHIAAHKSVHGSCALHVGLYVHGGFVLVGRVLV